jgi:hypothetical protein
MLWLVLPLLVPVAAVAWLVRCGGRWRVAGLVLGHLVVCDVLALGALAAGGVAYGNHLGDSDAVATLQPAFLSSQVTHDRYGRQAWLSSAILASSGSSSRP